MEGQCDEDKGEDKVGRGAKRESHQKLLERVHVGPFQTKTKERRLIKT